MITIAEVVDKIMTLLPGTPEDWEDINLILSEAWLDRWQCRTQQLIEDKKRLDFLQSCSGSYSGKVICRDSVTGRGWRLHESRQDGAVADVRKAIDAYMTQKAGDADNADH